MQRVGRSSLVRTLAAGCRPGATKVRFLSSSDQSKDGRGNGPKTDSTDPFQVQDDSTAAQPKTDTSNENMIIGGTSAGFSPDAGVSAKQRFDPNGKTFKFETKPR